MFRDICFLRALCLDCPLYQLPYWPALRRHDPKAALFVHGFPLTLKFWWKESPNVNASENSSFLENTGVFLPEGFYAVMSNSGNSKTHILQNGDKKTGFDESRDRQHVFDLGDQTTYVGNTFVLFYLNLDPPNCLH